MTDSDTMWRWWHRVALDLYPTHRPPPPLSFDQIVFEED